MKCCWKRIKEKQHFLNVIREAKPNDWDTGYDRTVLLYIVIEWEIKVRKKRGRCRVIRKEGHMRE